MTVLVTMQQPDEKIRLDEDFVGMVNGLNMHSAQGKSFMFGQGVDGKPVAIHIGKILHFTEEDAPTL